MAPARTTSPTNKETRLAKSFLVQALHVFTSRLYPSWHMEQSGPSVPILHKVSLLYFGLLIVPPPESAVS